MNETYSKNNFVKDEEYKNINDNLKELNYKMIKISK